MGYYFKTGHVAVDQIMNRALNRLDLTAAQSHIIGYLSHTEGAPCAREVETFFQLSHSTVSGLLSRMEAQGFIAIRPDSEDRRVKRIYLLEKGLSCAKQIESSIQQTESQALQGFTPVEKEIFLDLLLRATDNLNREAQSNHSQREE